MQNKVLLVLKIFIPHLLILMSLFYFFKNQSGGDIAFNLFLIVSFVLYAIVWIYIAFNSDLQSRITIIIGLVLLALIEKILFYFIA
jgi:hypothetical protein